MRLDFMSFDHLEGLGFSGDILNIVLLRGKGMRAVLENDALRGANGKAEFASGAVLFNDLVLIIQRANEGINGAGFDAEVTTYAAVDLHKCCRDLWSPYNELRGLPSRMGEAI
jgi:hypothetical protein